MIFKMSFWKTLFSSIMAGLILYMLFLGAFALYYPLVLGDFGAYWLSSLPRWVYFLLGMDSALNPYDPFACILRASQVMLLAGTIHFACNGACLVRRHEKRGELEFFISRMTKRSSCFMQLWWLGVLRVCIVMGIAYIALTVLSYIAYVDVFTVWGTYLYLVLRMGMVWLTACTIGLGFGALCKKACRAFACTMAVGAVVFVCGVLPNFLPMVSWLAHVGLYHSVVPEQIIFSGFAFTWGPYLTAIELTALGIVGGIFSMKQRQLPSLDGEGA